MRNTVKKMIMAMNIQINLSFPLLKIEKNQDLLPCNQYPRTKIYIGLSTRSYHVYIAVLAILSPTCIILPPIYSKVVVSRI